MTRWLSGHTALPDQSYAGLKSKKGGLMQQPLTGHWRLPLIKETRKMSELDFLLTQIDQQKTRLDAARPMTSEPLQ